MNKKLRDVAIRMWRMVREHHPGGTYAAQVIMDTFKDEAFRLKDTDPEAAMAYAALWADPGAYVMSVGFVQWVECGMPMVDMGQKFCASLLVSAVDAGMLTELRRPWPAFVINIPGDMLRVDDLNKKTTPLTSVLVVTIPGGLGDWGYFAMPATASSSVSLYRYGCNLEKLQDAALGDGKLYAFDEKLTSMDERTAALVGRLIVATVAALTMQELVQETGKSHVSFKAAKNDPSQLHNPRVFTLGKPIVLDFRDRVREYVNGTRKATELSVQSVVRGHFKRQRFGKGNASVKTIWREPFWRGPKDAPVLVRAHVLGDTTDEK